MLRPPVRISTATISGWRFEARTGGIDDPARLVALSRRLADPYTEGERQCRPFCVHGATRSLKPCLCGAALIMGVNCHMPEAVFGQNSLTVTHLESGTAFDFDAEGALRMWAQHSSERGSRSIRCVHGRLASWRNKMVSAQLRTSVDADWTFDCEGYSGNACVGGVGSIGSGEHTRPSTPSISSGVDRPFVVSPHQMQLSVVKSTRSIRAALREEQGPPCRIPLEWRAHLGNGIDMELLKRREPILWHATVPLFRDDMHDQGQSELTVRIRVMPSCFFILLQHRMRVDQVLIQLRETRVFHKYGSAVVLRSHRLSQQELTPLVTTMSRVKHLSPPCARVRAWWRDWDTVTRRLAACAATEECLEETQLPSLQDTPAILVPASSKSPPPAIRMMTAVVVMPYAPNPDEERGRPPQRALLSALAASTCGMFVAMGDVDGGIALLCVSDVCRIGGTLKTGRIGETDMQVEEIWRNAHAHAGAVTCLCVDSTGRIYSSAEDGSCAIWDTFDGAGHYWMIEGDGREDRMLPLRRPHPSHCCRSKAKEGAEAKAKASSKKIGRNGTVSVVQLVSVCPSLPGFAAAVGGTLCLLSRDCPDAPVARLDAGRTIAALATVASDPLAMPTAESFICAAGYGGVVVWAVVKGAAAGGEQRPRPAIHRCAVLPYNGPIDSLAISPGRRYIAGGAQDSTLVMWPLDQAIRAETVGQMEQKRESLISVRAEAADEADAALAAGATLFFGGGCYTRKVGPLAWSQNGRLCASAGGNTIVIWDVGPRGQAPPVRKNGCASLLDGHNTPVAWVGITPHVGSAACTSITTSTQIASVSADGRVMLHSVPSEPPYYTEPGYNGRNVVKLNPIAASAAGAVSGTGPVVWGGSHNYKVLFCCGGDGTLRCFPIS